MPLPVSESQTSARALQYARTALNVAVHVAGLSPFSQVQTILKIGSSIVASLEVVWLAEAVNTVKLVFANLAAQVGRTLKFIVETLDKDHQIGKTLAKDLKELTKVLEGIADLIEARQERGTLIRLFLVDDDTAKAKSYSRKLDEELKFFALKCQVRTSAGVDDLKKLLRDLHDEIASLKSPATPSGPSKSPTIPSPEDAKHIRRKSDIGPSKAKGDSKADSNGKEKSPGLTASSKQPNQNPQTRPPEPKLKRSKSVDGVAWVASNKSKDSKNTKDTPSRDRQEQPKKSEKPPTLSKSDRAQDNGKSKGGLEKKENPSPKSAEKSGQNWKGKGKATDANKEGKTPWKDKNKNPEKSGNDIKGGDRPETNNKSTKDLKDDKKPQDNNDKSSSVKQKKEFSDKVQNADVPKTPDSPKSDKKTEKPAKDSAKVEALSRTMQFALEALAVGELHNSSGKHRRTNSTGAMDKGKLTGDAPAPKVPLSPPIDDQKPQRSKSERSPNPSRNDHAKLKPDAKTDSQSRQRRASDAGPSKKPQRKIQDDAADDAASVRSSESKTRKPQDITFVVSPPSIP